MYSFLVNLVHLFRVCVPNEYDEFRYVVVFLPLFSSPSQKNGGRDVFRNFRREIFRLYIYLSFRDNENSNDSGANADERRVNNPLPPNFSIKIDLTQINSLKLSRDCGKF